MKRTCTVLLFLPIAVPFAVAEERLDLAEFAKDVQRFAKIRKEVGLPDHLRAGDAKRSGKELDLTAYFEIFQSVRVKPGHVLDWVYSLHEATGRPVIYTRKQGAKPFITSAELVKSVRDEANLDAVVAAWEDYDRKYRELEKERAGEEDAPAEFEFDAFAQSPFDKKVDRIWKDLETRLKEIPRHKYSTWWREDIRTDGTPQSYLELGVLYLLAGEFALYWHSNAYTFEVVPDAAALKTLVANPILELDGKEFLPEDVAERALKLDPRPQVKIKDDNVEVSFLTFTRWGGFIRKSLTITAKPPHILQSEKEQIEVKWHCGITF